MTNLATQTHDALITLITDAANELALRSEAASTEWQSSLKAYLAKTGPSPKRPAIHVALEDSALCNALYDLTGCDELYAMATDFEPEPDSQDGPTDVAFDYRAAQTGARAP
jgi:hypothetical protein